MVDREHVRGMWSYDAEGQGQICYRELWCPRVDGDVAASWSWYFSGGSWSTPEQRAHVTSPLPAAEWVDRTIAEHVADFGWHLGLPAEDLPDPRLAQPVMN